MTYTNPLMMVPGGNSSVTPVTSPGNVYSLPYPPEANCADPDVCPTAMEPVYRNNAHSRMTDHVVGFVVGFTAAPSSRQGGFLLTGSPAGDRDEGNLVVFYYDPAPGADPFDGDHEFGFVRHVDTRGRGQHLAFYQQYSSNTGACQSNSPLVDLTDMGFTADLPGTCLQVRVLSNGDYEVSQYGATAGRCTGAGAELRTARVENCSLHGTCMPRTRPTTCAYTTQDVNFYTGENTHNPSGMAGESALGTNGILFAVAKKIAGTAGLHGGSSLTGFYQLLILH